MAPESGPHVEVVPAGSTFFQSYRRWIDSEDGWSPGRPLCMDFTDRSRFNSPSGSFGTTYLAEQEAGAFLETFIRNPGAGMRGYSCEDIAARALAVVEITSDLALVQCYGPGLSKNGLTASVSGTDKGEYDASQSASESWYHGSNVDGVIYMGRLDNTIRCVALYDRAEEKARVVDTIEWFDVSCFDEILNRYDLSEVD